MSYIPKKITLSLLTLLLFVTTSVSEVNDDKLIVFHMDFNSVTLKKDYILKWLNKAADMGYNAVLWEIEDEIQWKTCPECASQDALTQDEFKVILLYSRNLGLEPIPLLQTIGHAEYVLQHERYHSFREDSTRYDCYCSTNKDVKEFLKRWIAEYIDLFGELKYFHLGGDEAYAFGTCSNCKRIVESEGENKLYADYITEIAKPLFDQGIRPGIWSDMMLSHPNGIDAISKEFIIWDWNYWDGDQVPNRVMVWGKGRITKDDLTKSDIETIPEILDKDENLVPFYTTDFLVNHGYDIVLSSTARSYGDGVFIGRNNLHVDNIYGAALKTNELDLLGTCVTSWAVRIPNYETQEVWFHIAPLKIENPDLNKNQILTLVSKNLFGLNNLKIYEVIQKIGDSFPFGNTNTTGIMWTGLKDSKPAPQNYIKELIQRRKDQNRWTEYESTIKNSTEIINQGTIGLNEVIVQSTKGSEILYNLSKGAHFNFWQSILANLIVDNMDGESVGDSEQIVKLISIIKGDYKNWAEEWMTKISAEQNTGLIYDAVQNYFKY